MTNTRHPLWLKLAAGVAVILLVGGVFMWEVNFVNRANPEKLTPVVDPHFPPGSNQAVLKMPLGRQISLDTTIQDTIFTDVQSIAVIHDGLLLYNPGKGQNDLISFDTLTTPGGGQWRVMLPDSTSIWLNASSSITYSSNRYSKVWLRGEAYFDVHKTHGQPFIVNINDTDHPISARQFNINAYPNEPRTTITRWDDPTTRPIDGTLRRDLDLGQAIGALESDLPGEARFHHRYDGRTLVILP